MNKYKMIYSDWSTKYHETFLTEQSIDLSDIDLNYIKKLKVKYRDVPGMIIEFNKDFQLIKCGITEDLSKILDRELSAIQSNKEHFLHIYTYMYHKSTKKYWHRRLGEAKKDLKDMMHK